jgi:hypothetical protein
MRNTNHCQFRSWFRGGFIYHTPFEICEYEYPLDMLVQQMTGLKDKLNNWIYEGDIIFNDDRNQTAVVKYDDNKAMFITEYEEGETYPLYESLGNRYYSIGNIYENPELK